MKNTILLFVVATCFIACEIKPELTRTWKISKLEAATSDTLSERLYQDVYLSFYNNGQLAFYQEYSDESGKHALYHTGTWKEHGSGLELSVERADFHHRFEVQELSYDWLILKFLGDTPFKGTEFKCRPVGYYRNKSYDMQDPAQNTWREKPRQKESQQQIETRVLNHVQYLVGYFNLVEEKEQTYFETALLQTPFRFHSNGISLPQDFEEENKWVSCFYDKEDAKTGAKMLIKSLRSIETYPASEESYTKGYHDAFVIMAEYLQK